MSGRREKLPEIRGERRVIADDEYVQVSDSLRARHGETARECRSRGAGYIPENEIIKQL
jgi:hypothetical protein